MSVCLCTFADALLSQLPVAIAPASSPLVALLPTHTEFDAEAVAATKVGLPVLRFDFATHFVLASGEAPRPCCAIWRGFIINTVRMQPKWMDIAFVGQIAATVTTQADTCTKATIPKSTKKSSSTHFILL